MTSFRRDAWSIIANVACVAIGLVVFVALVFCFQWLFGCFGFHFGFWRTFFVVWVMSMLVKVVKGYCGK